jgi:hypothetical protein
VTRQPCMKRLLAPITCLLMILALASGSLGQKAGRAGGAREFDSFNQLHSDDLAAHLDNFAITLQSDEGVSGYIVAYGPAGEGSGSAARYLLSMEDYLVNSRGIEKDRLRTVYGGHYKDPKDFGVELWLVPVGAEPPAPRKYKNNLKSFTGKYEEYLTSDYLYEADGDMGPYAGDPSSASLVEALRQRPSTRAYVVVRSSPRAVTGAWRRVAKCVAERLEDGSAIKADRVKIIFAGYDRKLVRDDDERDDGDVKVQLWLLPEDAPPPAKEVKAERRPSEAVQLGRLDEYRLYDPGNAKHVFEGLADVLNADRELRGCIIYRPSTLPPDPETESDSSPRVDLDQLVWKLKGELTTKYKIDETRLVIISAAATRESDDGTVEAWVVPPGAALPDAYPPPEEQGEYAEDAAEESPQ